MSDRISRADYPHGAALWRVDGRVFAGVGLDRDGVWTWWCRRTGARRQPAMSRDDAIAQARVAVEREVS